MKNSLRRLGVCCVIGMTLAGCASQPKVKWVASKTVDEFTDQVSCRVTTGSIYTHSSVYTETGKLYPMIEQVNGQLRVGLQSGGKYKIPVGNLQLRIDSNKAWNINTSETPIDMSSTVPVLPASYTENLPEEQKKMISDAMASSTKAMSPYTVATGKKAKQILQQMLAGKELKYRTVGFNQAASTTGIFALDESLQSALKECHIQY